MDARNRLDALVGLQGALRRNRILAGGVRIRLLALVRREIEELTRRVLRRKAVRSCSCLRLWVIGL